MASAVVLVVTGSAGAASNTTTATTGSTASAANVAVLVDVSGAVGVTVLADTVVGRLGSVVQSTCALITESCGETVSVAVIVGEVSSGMVYPAQSQ